MTRKELQTIRDLRQKLDHANEVGQRQARIAHSAVKDANFMRSTVTAFFDVAGAAEKLLEAGMPRGASYLLAALQTIESEYNETRLAVMARGGSPAGGDGS